MSFRKLRIAPILTREGVDKYPTYGPFIKLQATDDNAIEITMNAVTKERTLTADDKDRITNKVLRYEGSLKVYEVDEDAAVASLGYTKDLNGNIIHVENNPNKGRFGIFFISETPNGKVYQKYIYDVEFKTPSFAEASDSTKGASTSTMTIPFTAFLISDANGKEILAANVYSGNSGFVADGAEPITMYKEVSA